MYISFKYSMGVNDSISFKVAYHSISFNDSMGVRIS